MALLDRVATLVRANLNDLIDRAEDPEKMLKQVILDMENQFLQVKTQVAIALADLLAGASAEGVDNLRVASGQAAKDDAGQCRGAVLLGEALGS